MSSKLNSGVCSVYMRGDAAWGMLMGKGRYCVVCTLQVTLRDSYLSALEAFAKMRYTNGRHLYF